jgi:nitroimidazol reductase NimA-like FMN-containing flavoprotein (pyridoxamine 5'-phosphate oxidase superfamily)
MPTREMSHEEVEQFLLNARVGRLGLSLAKGVYVVPLGYAYAEGKVFFHTCNKGVKMEALRNNPNVCFEVDESLSDASMYKSVIVFGKAEIIDEREKMIPYLQKLIDKYRVPEPFNDYMNKPTRNREKELASVRICVITPTKVTGKKFIAKSDFLSFTAHKKS